MFNKGIEFKLEKEKELKAQQDFHEKFQEEAQRVLRAHEEFHEKEFRDQEKKIKILASIVVKYKKGYQLQIEKCTQLEQEKESIKKKVADLKENLSEQNEIKKIPTNQDNCADTNILLLQESKEEEEEEDHIWDEMEQF